MSNKDSLARRSISASIATIFLASAAPVYAGCNSGNVANGALLSSSSCEANAVGVGATAVGLGATASGLDASAVGLNATASGIWATAFGFTALVNKDGATAVGALAQASGMNSSAFGSGAIVQGDYATAVGYSAGAGFPVEGMVAVGAFAGGNLGTYSVALGSNTQAAGNNSIAIGGAPLVGTPGATGFGAASVGLQSIAVGLSSVSADLNAIAVGVGANATSSNAIAIGPATQSANSAVAVGPNTTAMGDSAVSIGSGTQSSGSTSVALGNAANSSADEAVALGNGSRGSSSGATALGAESSASNSGAVAVGLTASASGFNAVAAGASSSSLATNAIAVGALSRAAKANAIALGSHARATAANAVALGAGSIATAASTVSVGAVGAERRITNVARAVNSTDAVNLGQLQLMLAAASQPSLTASDAKGGRSASLAVPVSLMATTGNAAAHSGQNEKPSSHSESSAAPSWGCANDDIAGNWSVIATNIEEVGTGSALWCEMELEKAGPERTYNVTGHCVGNTPRDTTEQHFNLGGTQSITLSPTCHIGGALTLRQGSTTINVAVLHGKVESTGGVKSRAVAVSRWSRGNKFTLQTLVLQR